jgi:competence protein ComGC
MSGLPVMRSLPSASAEQKTNVFSVAAPNSCITETTTRVRMRISLKRWIIVGTCLAGPVVIAIALPCIIPAPEKQGESRAKAAILAEDTNAVHNAIAAYSEDHGHQPKCLDELVTSGYLKTIPRDVLTKAKSLGLAEQCD